MTARAPYRAPQLTELGSVAQMTQVNLVAGPLFGNVQACLIAQAAGLTAVVNADGGCAIAATS
jgi:hypothetical protein